MSPEEYGRLSVLLAVFAVVAVIMAAGLDYGVFRQYFQLESEPDQRHMVVQSSWRLSAVAALALAAVAAAVIFLAAEAGLITRPAEKALVFLAAALMVSATTVPFTVLRAEQRLKPFIALSLTSAIGMGGFTFLLVVVLHLGVIGWLCALNATNLCVLFGAFLVVPWHPRSGYQTKVVIPALKLGFTLLPSFVAHWALQVADRLLLAVLVTGSALGRYSLASNIAFPVFIVLSSINQGFMPSYARNKGTDEQQRAARRASITQVACVCLVGCAASLLGPCVVTIGAPAEYAQSAQLVPWIVLGFCFLGLYYIPMNVASLTAGRAGFVWIITSVSAILNLALIYALVPIYGLIAAAVAAAVGYLALLVGVSYYVFRMGLSVQIPVIQSAVTIGVALLTYAGAVTTVESTDVAGMALRSLWLIAPALALCSALGLFDRAGSGSSALARD